SSERRGTRSNLSGNKGDGRRCNRPHENKRRSCACYFSRWRKRIITRKVKRRIHRDSPGTFRRSERDWFCYFSGERTNRENLYVIRNEPGRSSSRSKRNRNERSNRSRSRSRKLGHCRLRRCSSRLFTRKRNENTSKS